MSLPSWKDDPLRVNGKIQDPKTLDPHDEWSRCEEVVLFATEDPLYWLTHLVYTKDQIDQKTPIKKFPAHKEYIQYFVKHIYPYERLIYLPKSRRMTCTWMILSLMTHRWWSGKGYAGFAQSKKEDDAGELIDRCKFIYQELPSWMQFPEDHLKFTQKPAKMENLQRYNWLWAIPQGPDQLRQYTASQILFDEAAFQERFSEAWTAAKPTLEGGGQCFVVSTSNGPGFFHDLVFDLLER